MAEDRHAACSPPLAPSAPHRAALRRIRRSGRQRPACLAARSPGSAWQIACVAAFAASALGLAAPASALPPAGCSDDVEKLEDAVRAEPDDADTHAALGRCYMALGRLGEAPGAFQAAVVAERGPLRRLELAIALYHAGRFDEAQTILDGLRDKLDDRPELHLYTGLLALERDEHARAAAQLDQARRLDPGAVEPVASYYAAIAWRESGDRDRAIEAFTRIANDWPDSAWSREAKRNLDLISGRLKWAFFGDAEVGFEWDSNVAILGRGVPLPLEISDESDERGVWLASAGAEVAGPDWHMGGVFSYSGSEHHELDGFDLHYPVLTLYGGHTLGSDSSLRIQYDAGHAWVGGSRFLTAQGLEAAVAHTWQWGRTEIFGGWLGRDYQVAPADDATTPAIDESTARDRDGNAGRAGIRHWWPTPVWLDRLRTHYAFEHYGADVEYTYDGHEIGVEIGATLPCEIGLFASTTYYARSFRDPSTFLDPGAPALSTRDKRDDLIEVRAELEREIAPRTILAARWRYERRYSNAQVFDYDRHIIGVYARVRLGAE